MKDAYYFSHDSNARHDKDIVLLRADHGWKGYGLFWAIIEILRDQADYRFPLKRLNALSIEIGDDVSSFIDDCINEYELFASDGECFWSESLKRRMEKREEVTKARQQAGSKGGKASSKSKAKAKQNASIKGKERKESKENIKYLPVASLLAGKIAENDPKFFYNRNKNRFIKDWADPIRLLIEKDGRSREEVEAVIVWCQEHSFWKSNIHSGGTLRKKFSKLLMQMKNGGKDAPAEDERIAREAEKTVRKYG